jgi:hypothetical protein
MREEARPEELRGGGEASGEENEEATLTVIVKKKRGGGISFRRGWKGRIKREAAMFFIRRNRLKTKKLFLIYFVDIFVFVKK